MTYLSDMSLLDHFLICLVLAIWVSSVLVAVGVLALVAFRIGEALGFKAE